MKPVVKKEEEKPLVEGLLDPSKWHISVQISPLYYSYLSSGNPFAQSLTQGTFKGRLTFAYGLLVNMPISEKLSFRIGYRRSNYEFEVNDALSGLGTQGNALFFRDPAIRRNAVPLSAAITDTINNGGRFALHQQMVYSEIPLECYYTLLDGKWTLDVIGGLNAQLLGKSTITLTAANESVQIGSAQYLRKAVITPILGLGIRYRLNDRLRFDLEPQIRYHLNGFTKDFQNRRPYIIGLQTGFTFKL